MRRKPICLTYLCRRNTDFSRRGSENGIVKVWNILGNEPISRFRNTSSARPSFRDGSVHPVISMMFHPHEMVLGVGATDAKLNVRIGTHLLDTFDA